MGTNLRYHVKLLSVIVLSSTLLICKANKAYCADQWFRGSGQAPLLGTDLINDIDTASKNYAFDPLDRLVSGYREGVSVQYNDASTLTVTAGEIVVLDAAGTTKLMLRNAASTTVNWTMIDTGSEAPSTTYYVYAVGASSSATSITFKISLSATAPTGVTYYKRIGYFYNNADSNIASIVNDNDVKYIGTKSSKTYGATYQATTDGFVVAWSNNIGYLGSLSGYSDSSSTPVTEVAFATGDTSENYINLFISFPVKKGDYYKVSGSGTDLTNATIYFWPFGN